MLTTNADSIVNLLYSRADTDLVLQN